MSRTFRAASLALALVALSGGTFWIGCPAAGASEMILAHIGGSISPHHTAATSFIADLNRRLPNRFHIEERNGTMMGGDVEIWGAVKLGALDLAIVTAAAITPAVPSLGVLQVPLLFRDSAHVTTVLNGPVGDRLGVAVAGQGAVLLSFIQRGFTQLTNAKRPIRVPADLVGLRIRVIPNPIYEATFKALGAEVVPMAWAGLYGALDDGRVDGQENPLLALAGQHFERVQKFVSLTAIGQSPLMLIINPDDWAALSADEKTGMIEAAHQAAAATLKEVTEKEAAFLAEFQAAGVTVVDPVDRAAFAAALAPLAPEWDRRFGADLIQQIRATR